MLNQSSPVRILIVDESLDDAENLLTVLRKGGYPTRPKLIRNRAELETVVQERAWDVVLAEARVDDLDAQAIMQIMVDSEHDLPVLFVTTDADESTTASLLRAGARDVIEKGRGRHLLCAIERELSSLEDRRRRRRAETMLRDIQRRNETLLETSEDAVAYVLDGMHIHVNRVYLSMFGFDDADEVEGLPMLDLVSNEDQERFRAFVKKLTKEKEFVNRAIEFSGIRDSGAFPVKMEFTSATYDGEDCCQISARDLSESEEIKRLSLITQQDSLTALYSHRYFLEKLEDMVSDAVGMEKLGVLLYIEIDNFDTIKERVGVAASDKVIRDIARVVQRHTDTGDTLARFGDVTFTLLSENRELNAVTEVAANICAAVGQHICDVDGQSVTVTCSIGATSITETAETAQTLLSRAGDACRTVARSGGNALEIYRPPKPVQSDRIDESYLVESIQQALLNEDRLELVFQPVVGLHSSNDEAYSTFLRVYDASGNPIPTETVFRIAEEQDIAYNLDEWVVNKAVQKLADRRQTGLKTMFFIKLSEQAIRDERMVFHIGKALKARAVPAEALALQISEASAVTQVKLAKAFVAGMKQLQCRTVLEHFGSGLDSFKLLGHIDVDFLKLDGSYTPDLAINQDNQQAIRDMMDKAKALEKQVIVPWVEDANSLAILFQLGVNYAQGNYIQEPVNDLSYNFAETS